MARLMNTPYYKSEVKYGTAEYDAREKDFEQLYASGKVVAFPWADGAAYYFVKKEKPLTLQWINFGDAWQVPYAYIRGFRKTDLDAQKEFQSLFM